MAQARAGGGGEYGVSDRRADHSGRGLAKPSNICTPPLVAQ
jgi:hypothetical protein